MTDLDAGTRRETIALRLSVAASILIGIVGVVWGLAVDSRVMLFDGFYTFLGTALSGLSLLASRFSSHRESEAFPFGLQASVPIAIVIQGAALLGMLGFALVDSIGLILTGGTEPTGAAVIAYAGVAAVASVLTILALRRLGGGSELVAAEVEQWKAGAILSALIGLGAGVTIVLVRLGVSWLAPYSDPLLVIGATLALVPVALGLIRAGGREVLEAAPPPGISTRIQTAADGVGLARGLGAPRIRATKLGRRLYVEVDYLVEPGTWNVDEEDAVRRELLAELEPLGLELWASIELTTDPELAV